RSAGATHPPRKIRLQQVGGAPIAGCLRFVAAGRLPSHPSCRRLASVILCALSAIAWGMLMKRALLSLALVAGLWPLSGQARTWGSLEFSECELAQPGSGATTRAECARLEVPEDPTQAEGRQISLKVAMLPARADEPAADPVIFLAGGPGQAATETFPAMAGALSRRRRTPHLRSLAPRGTGASRPLACPLPGELARDTPPERLLALGEQCLAALDADVAQYTTSVAVQDIEALRLALGAPALNVYGGSYGTRVAQQYARQYPGSVRALV